MPIAQDFQVNFTTKHVKYAASATKLAYSVNQLYSYLMDVADEQQNMDDTVMMSAQTPTEYTLTNGWWMSHEDIKGLTGGAIVTNASSGYIRMLEFAAAAYTAPDDTDYGGTVTSDGDSSTGVLMSWDNFSKKWWVRSSYPGGVQFSTNSAVLKVTGGAGVGTQSASGKTGEYTYTNIYTLGSVVAGTQLYVLRGSYSANLGSVSSWWGTGMIDILVPVRESGSAIYNGYLTIYAREYGATYDHFLISAPSGRNAVPLAAAADGFNSTTSGALTATSVSTVTITRYVPQTTLDIDNGAGARPYDIVVDCKGVLLSSVYQWLKLKTGREYISDIDDGGGSITGAWYTEASLSAQYTEVKTSPFGTYSGTFFGAKGVALTNLHASNIQSYSLIDSSGATQNPPNVQTVQVTGVEVGDQVFVAETVGGAIRKNKYTLSANPLSAVTILIDNVAGAISGDTVKYGTIRVTKASTNLETSYAITGWSGSAFALSSGVSTNSVYTAADYAYVPFIDETVTAIAVGKTIIYTTDIPVLVRVRKKGIIPFEIGTTIQSAGMTQAAIRTTDTIVT